MVDFLFRLIREYCVDVSRRRFSYNQFWAVPFPVEVLRFSQLPYSGADHCFKGFIMNSKGTNGRHERIGFETKPYLKV